MIKILVVLFIWTCPICGDRQEDKEKIYIINDLMPMKEKSCLKCMKVFNYTDYKIVK